MPRSSSVPRVMVGARVSMSDNDCGIAINVRDIFGTLGRSQTRGLRFFGFKRPFGVVSSRYSRRGPKAQALAVHRLYQLEAVGYPAATENLPFLCFVHNPVRIGALGDHG